MLYNMVYIGTYFVNITVHKDFQRGNLGKIVKKGLRFSKVLGVGVRLR